MERVIAAKNRPPASCAIGKGRRRVALVVITLAVPVGAWAVWHSLGTCGLLDRWTFRSGCQRVVTLEHFDPALFLAMVPIEGTRMRIFGTATDGDAPQAVEIVFDAAAGESQRGPLRMGQAPFRVAISADQSRVALICLDGVLCDAQQPKGFVYAARDGSLLRDLPDKAAALDAFADTAAPESVPFDATWLADGRTVAQPDPRTGGIVLSEGWRGASLAVLTPPEPSDGSRNPFAFQVRASPSGRYVLLLNNEAKAGTRLDIWDLEEAKLLRTLRTDGAGRLSRNVAWSADERHVVGLRTQTGERAGQGGPADVTTEAILFRVR